MTAQQLTGADFAAMVQSGHARLKKMIGAVNALNVFPVPDGDTGTNMEMSLASGVRQLQAATHEDIAEMTQALASGLLMGARGNSGVILSQLFRGFAKATQQTQHIDIATFAKSLQEGVQIAYRAVAKPVEGTILTVAREAAATGVKAARTAASLQEWMQVVYQAANDALQRTPEQLPVLKQAGVVDSGGQGLVYVYEGFLQWMRGESTETVRTEVEATVHALDFAAAHIDHEGEYGYCTEVLIRLETDDAAGVEAALRAKLSEYGDSLLVVGTDDLVKVHVHTLRPGRVLEDAMEYGVLAKIKIDNMTEQHATIHEAGKSAEVDTEPTGGPSKALAVVAVAAGDGLSEVFQSLGVDVVLSGGQTMNPSTEEIVAAVKSTHADTVLILPNNKNIVLTAQQAAEFLGDYVRVVPSTSIPQGIAAMMAFLPDQSVTENGERMTAALNEVHSGEVVRAVRDSVFQGQEIRENQYLGLDNQDLACVGDSRLDTVMEVVRAMGAEGAELLTVFYGDDVPEQELNELVAKMESQFGLEVELKFGGQPVYDYIFSLE